MAQITRGGTHGGRRLTASLVVSILAVPALVGCGREGQAAPRASAVAAAVAGGATGSITPVAPPSPPPQTPRRPLQSAQADIPAMVAHPGNIQAGLPAQHPLRVLANPREHDPRAIEEGKVLFVSYNCSDCHGGDGSGGMGPSLQDGRWHFGGSAGEVYESISEGRPDGMPSWGGRISDSQIWALVAYVRTLSSGKDVTTQTFDGGGTVARGGH
jgi:mono/diheme cytochrome c family protein